jgi:UDP-N-acetylmuramate--alanine ligase
MTDQQNHIDAFIKDVSLGEAKGKRVYFLGIGGIGMSAIARYFKSRGVVVSGYDKTETALTLKLIEEGFGIHYTDDVNSIDKESSLFIYTPAIPKNHKAFNYLIENGFPIYKRSEVLGMIINMSYNICVAGTHGKTTTSTMIAHVLRDSDFGCNAFLGGISSNYNTNFWTSEKNVCVAEADEYDRSFLKLTPDVAVITSIDPDHLDIYETAENFVEAFFSFSQKIKPGGLLISKFGLNNANGFESENQLTYSVDDKKADCFAFNIMHKNGSYFFDVKIIDQVVNGLSMHMGGMHNLENAIAAIAVAKHLGISDEKIIHAVSNFKGVKRRFEYIVHTPSLIMIDDYAHHPQELSALIQSAKGLFAEKKCTLIFQPHLFTRTRDFAEGFASVLNMADEVFLLPIYPARELPIEGVNSEMIASLMNNSKVKCFSKTSIVEIVKQKLEAGEIEMLITAGAGDIDTLVEPLKNTLIK